MVNQGHSSPQNRLVPTQLPPLTISDQIYIINMQHPTDSHELQGKPLFGKLQNILTNQLP